MHQEELLDKIYDINYIPEYAKGKRILSERIDLCSSQSSGTTIANWLKFIDNSKRLSLLTRTGVLCKVCNILILCNCVPL